MSGFVAKISLVDAAAASHQWAMVGLSVAVGLLTLFALVKIWAGVFWAPRETEDDAVSVSPALRSALGGPVLMVGPTAVLVALTLGLGLAAGPTYDLTRRAAADLIDPRPYVVTVLGEGADAPAARPTGEGGG
jgi:multicomponent Na+:H+ antiporter subunit D